MFVLSFECYLHALILYIMLFLISSFFTISLVVNYSIIESQDLALLIIYNLLLHS